MVVTSHSMVHDFVHQTRERWEKVIQNGNLGREGSSCHYSAHKLEDDDVEGSKALKEKQSSKSEEVVDSWGNPNIPKVNQEVFLS